MNLTILDLEKQLKTIQKEIAKVPENSDDEELMWLEAQEGLLEQLIKKAKRKPKPNIIPLIQVNIKDFTKDKNEPAYDVEVYIKGKFQDTFDGVISTSKKSKKDALVEAIKYTRGKLAILTTQIINNTKLNLKPKKL